MKNPVIHLATSFFIILLISSCGGNKAQKTNNEADTRTESLCGELIDFQVDDKYCKKYNLPEVEFSTRVPKDLMADEPREGEQNFHYNYYLKWDENEVQTESISLGYMTMTRNSFMKESLSMNLLQQLRGFWAGGGFELSDEFMGKEEFDGEDYLMFRAKGSIDDKELEFVGDYHILCILKEADVDDKNGILVMMLANQDSPISSFEDFATKGCISEVWKNLTFEF